jgi:hypothetical protein
MEAAAVYGEADVILKIQGQKQVEQDKSVSDLRKIPHIYSTQTYRVINPIKNFYFSRYDQFDLSPDHII